MRREQRPPFGPRPRVDPALPQRRVTDPTRAWLGRPRRRAERTRFLLAESLPLPQFSDERHGPLSQAVQWLCSAMVFEPREMSCNRDRTQILLQPTVPSEIDAGQEPREPSQILIGFDRGTPATPLFLASLHVFTAVQSAVSHEFFLSGHGSGGGEEHQEHDQPTHDVSSPAGESTTPPEF